VSHGGERGWYTLLIDAEGLGALESREASLVPWCRGSCYDGWLGLMAPDGLGCWLGGGALSEAVNGACLNYMTRQVDEQEGRRAMCGCTAA
jgi:hypothetical protein